MTSNTSNKAVISENNKIIYERAYKSIMLGVAKRLLDKGHDPHLIAVTTNLTFEELENIKMESAENSKAPNEQPLTTIK